MPARIEKEKTKRRIRKRESSRGSACPSIRCEKKGKLRLMETGRTKPFSREEIGSKGKKRTRCFVSNSEKGEKFGGPLFSGGRKDRPHLRGGRAVHDLSVRPNGKGNARPVVYTTMKCFSLLKEGRGGGGSTTQGGEKIRGKKAGSTSV